MGAQLIYKDSDDIERDVSATPFIMNKEMGKKKDTNRPITSAASILKERVRQVEEVLRGTDLPHTSEAPSPKQQE